MVRWSRRALAVVGTGGLLLSLAACGGGGGDSESDTIKIGVIAPLSGDSASAGQDILDSSKVAAKEINDAGGIDGKMIEIVEADDACSPQQGATAAQKLVNSDVVAVAGGYCSGAAIPAAPIFGRVSVPFVIDAATNPVLTDDGDGKVFRTCGRDDRQGVFAADFIANELKATKAAILHDNTTYAKGLAEATSASLEETGSTEVTYLDALSPGQADYTPVLTKIASTNPDVLYFTGYYAESGLLIKQAKQLGLTFQIMGGDATTDATALTTAGAAAEGYIATTAPLPNALPSAEDFVAAYKEETGGTEPGPFSVYQYDAVKVIAAAIDAADSTDPADITKALHDLKGFEGVTGPISFDDKGDRVVLNYITAIVKEGKFVSYKKLDESGAWVDAA